MLCDDLEGWDGGEREAEKEGNFCINIFVCIFVCVYTYGWFMLLYSRNQQIINQLPSN